VINPCCEPTIFYNSEGQPRTFFDSLYNSENFAASLRHLTRFIARFIPLPRAYDVEAKRSSGASAQDFEDSPEICRGLDAYGFSDFKRSTERMRALTSVYDIKDPRRFNFGTQASPQDGTCAP
jgi:hypothetical protein